MNTTRLLLTVSAVSFGLLIGGAAAHADSTTPHSWKWPVYVRNAVSLENNTVAVMRGRPRPAVWGSVGEFQNFAPPSQPPDPYIHVGVDIKGDAGDPVILPTEAHIIRVFNNDDDCHTGGRYCRVWFKTTDAKRMFYFAHLDLRPVPAPNLREMPREVRDLVQTALDSKNPSPTIPEGTFVSTMVSFMTDYGPWHHAHLGVADPTQNYDLVDPLALLEQEAAGDSGGPMRIVDDEPPVLGDLYLVREDDTDAIRPKCGGEVWGAVNIVGKASDTFYTDGDFDDFPGKSWQQPTTGILTARYWITSLPAGNIVKQGTWYDMSQVPNTCKAPYKGKHCLTTIATDDEFFKVTDDGKGAPSGGTSFVGELFHGRSKSEYWSHEEYWHIFNHENGLPGAWDTSSVPPGRYQVTVEVEDSAGLKSRRDLSFSVISDESKTSCDPPPPPEGTIYYWDQSQQFQDPPTTDMGSADNRFCFLTSVSGAFVGAGESLHAYVDGNDRWQLGGSSGQRNGGVRGSATCVSANRKDWAPPVHAIFPGNSVKLLETTSATCFITGLSGHFEGGGERIWLTRDTITRTYWFEGASDQGNVWGEAACLKNAYPSDWWKDWPEGCDNACESVVWLTSAQPNDHCGFAGIGGDFNGGGEFIGVMAFNVEDEKRWFLVRQAGKDAAVYARPACMNW